MLAVPFPSAVEGLLPPNVTPSPLDRIRTAIADRYTIEREVGRGGMATVYRARDERHGRAVAIKVLHAELAEAVGTERFLREVQITAGLAHPHILPLLDSGAADGQLFYVMPFIEGETLRARLTRDGELPVDEAMRLVREVADALGYAHMQGIVHRDIKPENILLQAGHALVADFGIARVLHDTTSLTQTGFAVGTPVYMSPEQASGAASVDGRSDLYALACVGYELLTGEPPYTGPNPMAITARKLTEAITPVRARRTTVSVAVETALTRALQRSPSDRFSTMAEFAGALQQAPEATGPALSPVRRYIWLAAAALLLAGAAAGWSVWRGRASAPTLAAGISSMAVLPFQNLTADTSQAYFAAGLADELVTSLSTVEGMRVASRTSTEGLLNRGLDLKAMAKELNVEAVLEGSVRLAGDRVKVATRLVNVAENRPVWSQTYERPVTDVLRIQEEIATAIVEAVRGRMHGANLEALRSGTTDPEAYNLYLQGTALRWNQTEQNLNTGVRLFAKAVERSPTFARGWVGLAGAYAMQGWYDFKPPLEVFPKSKESAERALAIDPRNGEALAHMAYAALYFDYDLPKAEQLFRKAIAVDPNAAVAHAWYGNYLTVAKRWDEAEREFREAIRLDPVPRVRRSALAWSLAYSGRYDRAVESYRAAAAYDSSYFATFQWGAIALEGAGLLDETDAALDRALVLSGRNAAVLANRARLYAIRGARDSARALLTEAMRARVVPPYEVAKVHLALGDTAEAFRWLDRGLESRVHSMVLMRIDPHLAPLRSNPRFEALARKIGL